MSLCLIQCFFVLCICVTVALVQVGVRLLATLMLEIHPAKTPMKNTGITDHKLLHIHMKTWYGSQMSQTILISGIDW